MQAISNVVLIFGGSSSEHKVSVASAQHLASVIDKPRLWFWAKSGEVYEESATTLAAHARPFEVEFVPASKPRYASMTAALDSASPEQTFFLALHGGTGEDGTIQGWLEEHRLYFTGSSAAASRRAFDKSTAKRIAKEHGVRIADSVVVSGADSAAAERDMRTLLERVGRVVVKPVADGSSVGLAFVDDMAGVSRALAGLAKSPGVPHLAEAFVEGTELTVGVVDSDDGTHALPCSEIRVERGRSFDYAGKYLGVGTREITPAEVSPEIHAAAGKLAVTAHQAIGCRGYSRTDFIVDARGPVFLEINNLPGLTRASFIPQQLAVAKVSVADFVRQQLMLARTRYMAD